MNRHWNEFKSELMLKRRQSPALSSTYDSAVSCFRPGEALKSAVWHPCSTAPQLSKYVFPSAQLLHKVLSIKEREQYNVSETGDDFAYRLPW